MIAPPLLPWGEKDRASRGGDCVDGKEIYYIKKKNRTWRIQNWKGWRVGEIKWKRETVAGCCRNDPSSTSSPAPVTQHSVPYGLTAVTEKSNYIFFKLAPNCYIRFFLLKYIWLCLDCCDTEEKQVLA